MATVKQRTSSQKPEWPTKQYSLEDVVRSPIIQAVHQQEESELMQLPQEIRDEIYAYVFSSTRFASGVCHLGQDHHRRIVLASKHHGLSMLRSCRRAHNEIGSTWLRQVLFHFESPEAMLDKLATIPTTIRSQIRHVRVYGKLLRLHFKNYKHHCTTTQVLKLLPGLNLEVLTVLEGQSPAQSYENLDSLLRYSDGWKELHYVSSSSGFLGYRSISFDFPRFNITPREHPRQRQPAGWQQALDQRDGATSSPSVTMYLTADTAHGTPCAVLHPNTRTAFTQSFAVGEVARTYSNSVDHALVSEREAEKEVLVIARRGSDVDYAENKASPHLATDDIRARFPGVTWEQVKAAQYDPDDDSLLAGCSDDEPEDHAETASETILVDSYDDVDDYTWPGSISLSAAIDVQLEN